MVTKPESTANEFQSGAATSSDTSNAPSSLSNAAFNTASNIGSNGTQTSKPREMKQRKGRFLIAPRRHHQMQMMDLSPLQFSAIEQALRDSPDIEIIDRVGPKHAVGTLATGMPDCTAVLVARMTDDKARSLSLQAQGQLIIERDQPLQLLDMNYAQASLVNCNLPTTGPAFTAEFLVQGNGSPIKDAEVCLMGGLIPASGITDAKGRVKLSLIGESAQSLRRLYVKPRSDYWSFCQEQPDVSSSEMNVIGLRALCDWPSLTNFPQQQQLTWGQRAMRLDQLPSHYRGQGIRIALIDSGIANTHQDLIKITRGYDVINKTQDTTGWTVDTIAHGSHCAGVIAGQDSTSGIRGFAPEAEVHAIKLFPAGQISQLIEALEYCIEKQIDVVNLSLGGAQPSEALEQQIMRAKQAGVACIVAAGNSSGPVNYPASSANVMAVAAIGRLNEFPPDSYHTQTVTPNVDANGFFVARFSCFGPEVAVCAPGVAITSSVPENSFAAWDGTSMAASHVVGLAALVLAHHPEFQGSVGQRSAERVERLFQVIKMSCRPVVPGDQRRIGFGMPDVMRAVGLAPLYSPQMMSAGMSSPLMQSLANVYREPPRLMPQTMNLGLGSFDPYGSYRPLVSSPMAMPAGYTFGIW
ncbi:MAG: S8 family serine peptidase [Burkholderiaceae bacterium]